MQIHANFASWNFGDCKRLEINHFEASYFWFARSKVIKFDDFRDPGFTNPRFKPITPWSSETYSYIIYNLTYV